MESLQEYRKHIDALDSIIVRTLAQRLSVCADVARFKKEHQLPIVQPQRIEDVKERAATVGAEAGLSRAFVMKLYSLIIDEACRVEDQLVAMDHDCAAGSSHT
jgi:chorismate mutase